MTIGSSKIARSERSLTTDWKVEDSPVRGMNCFGRLSRDSGQTRVPDPPHMITGMTFPIGPSIRRRQGRSPDAHRIKSRACRGADWKVGGEAPNRPAFSQKQK